METARTLSRDVRIKTIRQRARKDGTTYTVAWTVSGHPHHQSFHQYAPARDLRSDLVHARQAGEWFDPQTGLPHSLFTRWHPDLVVLERSELDRLAAAAERGLDGSKPCGSAATPPDSSALAPTSGDADRPSPVGPPATAPQAPGSWQELATGLPYATEAFSRGDIVIDARRRAEALLADAAQIGFIARREQQRHLVFDTAELDEHAPGWRGAIEPPGDHTSDAYRTLVDFLDARLDDGDLVEEIIWCALTPVTGGSSSSDATEPAVPHLLDPVQVQVSRRIVHTVTLPASRLDRAAPGWRDALADGQFQGDGAEEPEIVAAIEGLVSPHVAYIEPDSVDDFEITHIGI